jgi:biotin carboxyl carrier protein
VLIDGTPLAVGLEPIGPGRARVILPGSPPVVARVVFVDPPVRGPDGIVRQEVVVDGWRVEVELEPERRATLRERARRAGEAAEHGGPTEVRSVFPGRVVSVAIAPGDTVAAGQPMLVVEAMKMQNELRSPRAGTIARVDVGPGATVEVGDLLVAIE